MTGSMYPEILQKTARPAWALPEVLHHGTASETADSLWPTPLPRARGQLCSAVTSFPLLPCSIFTDILRPLESCPLRVFNVSHLPIQPSTLKDPRKWDAVAPCQEMEGSWWNSSTNLTPLRILCPFFLKSFNAQGNLTEMIISVLIFPLQVQTGPLGPALMSPGTAMSSGIHTDLSNWVFHSAGCFNCLERQC